MMKVVRRNKKGQVDVLATALILFAIAFVCIVVYKVMSGVNTSYQTIDNITAPQPGKTGMQAVVTNLGSGFDQGIVVALGFIFVLTLVFAFQINTNPGYFWIFLFILILVLGTTAILAQTFEQATNTGQFTAERAALPMIAWVGSNIFSIAAAMAVLLMVVIFAKINSGGGQ